MKSRISLSALCILTAAAHTVMAGTPGIDPPTAAPIASNPNPSRWRLGVGYAPLIGLKTEFSGLGNFSPAFQAQPLGGGVDYNYDNGFVRVDSSDNFGDETWNWGYENASQVDPSGLGSVDFSLTRSLADGSVDEDGGGEAGIELFGYLDMGAVTIPMLEKRGATWGFRGGFHYDHVNVENQSTVSSSTVTQTDRFSLNGTAAPSAPYRGGSFDGPGPLISDSPSRSFGSGTSALISGSRDLDVHLNIFSLGSYLELPVLANLSLMFEGGVSAGIAAGSYDFQSSTSITGLGSRQSSGSDSQTRVLPGFYLGIEAIYQLDKNWAIQAGGRYQYMDEFNLESNGSSASLSFDSAFILSLGTVYSF
jgi:hypothetical protein